MRRARTARQGLMLYLAAWAVIFPVQTVVVYLDTDPHGNDWMYWAPAGSFRARH